MQVKEILNIGIEQLKENNIEEPILKARILLAHILKLRKEDFIIHDCDEISIENENRFNYAIEKIANGKPLEHITNNREFMKMNFYVDENVLIPRADTEILVEEVIKYCSNEKKYNVLDLCTGSGAIAISIAKYVENVQVLGTDISLNALQIAKRNAIINNVKNITFKNSDLFENIQEKFDVIVSNPPYIKTSVIECLTKDVKNEPHIALDGGEDGLYFYKKIANYAYNLLNEDGALFLEIGYDQAKEVINLLKNTKKYKDIECIKDLYGNDRVIKCFI